MLARADRDRNSTFVGLCFPPDFPCHRSTKATSQRISSFVHGKLAGSCVFLFRSSCWNVFPGAKMRQRPRSPAITGSSRPAHLCIRVTTLFSTCVSNGPRGGGLGRDSLALEFAGAPGCVGPRRAAARLSSFSQNLEGTAAGFGRGSHPRNRSAGWSGYNLPPGDLVPTKRRTGNLMSTAIQNLTVASSR